MEILVDRKWYDKKGYSYKHAPKGKKFDKIPVFELAKTSGCDYVAKVTVANPRKLGQAVKCHTCSKRNWSNVCADFYTLSY